MAMILRAGDVSPDAPVGGKARALASAQAAGMPVPDWFVVTSEAVEASLGARSAQGDAVPTSRSLANGISRAEPLAGLEALQEQASPSTTEPLTMSPALSLAIRDALEAWSHKTLAVRSSASDEDEATCSLAGQLESLLDVRRGEVPEAVARVWRSGFSARVSAYRTQTSTPTAAPTGTWQESGMRGPAVIVQRMVQADASGVAFSADPMSGQRGVAVVTAVRGHGASLVSGWTDADSWHLDRGYAVIRRRLADRTPALTDDRVKAVAALARRAATHFGRPQDIEWAFEGDTLWLLQARPITTLHQVPDPEAAAILWDNSNIVESYGGVTTPLTFSFVSDAYEHVYRQFCRAMRVSTDRIDASDDAFRNMLGLIRGRMYYNLGNWYRVLSLLPGFTLNRRFMEQMMGVQGEAPGLDKFARPSRVRDVIHLVRTAVALIWSHLTIDRRVRRFQRRLTSALAQADLALSDMRPDELLAHYRALRARLLLSWDAPVENDFLTMIFHGALRAMTRVWCGDADGSIVNALLTRQGGLLSAEPAERLRRLAGMVREDEPFVALLTAGEMPAIMCAIGERSAFAAEYRAYLDRFGERTINELKLETVTLHDDPIPLFRAIGRLAVQSSATSTCVTSNDAEAAIAQDRIAHELARRPIRRAVLRWVTGHARARVRDRELLRLDRTRLFGRVRRIFVALGKALHARQLLDDPHDVFYLTVDEVIGFVEGRSVCTSLRGLVRVRQDEFMSYARQRPPESRFETHDIVYTNRFVAETPVPASSPSGSDDRQGLGCCRGIVRGRVQIIDDPGTVVVRERSVLVATHTDPGWILLFPSALAVVVERGSLLSHTAIVARELGIPSVVSVAGATAWLADGDWVEVDGSSGRVSRLSRADNSADARDAGVNAECPMPNAEHQRQVTRSAFSIRH
jgi:phosphohistidine swiveling domain-containing protein